MDRVIDLSPIVQREMAWYASGRDFKAKGYFLEDAAQSAYSIIIVPDADHPFIHEPSVIMMARIVGDNVIIDEDKTDRPLYEALIEAGIPREKIIAAYAGEKLPDENQTPQP